MYRENQENAVLGGLDNSSSTRSSRHPQSSQPGLADQAAKLSFASAESLETMSEAELPLGFNRMNRFRQSLPLSRSTSQTKLRSPGVLFLQYGDETRRVHITHEISSMDTLHALIVHMFQQKLTMGMLKSHSAAILIKDESRNVFYELEDVRDIQDRSIIKIYRKEPIYSSFPAPHITNGDVRREMMYSSRDSSPTRRLNSMSPAPHMASGSPPPVIQSSSPARSRMSYSGGRPPSYAGSPVHHNERMSGLPPAQGVSPSPSAILERRDVKPDEDLSNKNVVLVKNEGLYADPYAMVHEGRLSITSTQSLAGLGDPFSYGGGLYKRGSVRSLSTYSATALQTDMEDGMYKPNSQIYGDTYSSGLGFRIPPSSPQKVSDSRMVDVQQSQGPHSPYSGPSSRSSPVRQTFRKDSSSSVFMDSPVSKQRNPSSSSGNNEIFPGPGERPLSGFSSPVPTKEVETRERMEAMEKQIASLTGLVQSALMRGSDSDSPSEKMEPATDGAFNTTATGHPSIGTPQSTPTLTSAGSATPADQSKAISRLHMQLHLHDLQHNANELRNQLQQLKKLQLQNQETIRSMLKRTETEISVRVTDTLRKHEDPLQRQRALVEEERLKYLNEEEMITHQLNDMEKSLEKIKRDLAHNHRLISVQELEDKAVVLKQLGENLTELKAQFPSLQSKMRVVLRVEVEAVKFLKEEPHRLDGLLKRCKIITDTLAQIRSPLYFSRQVDEGVWNTPENLHNSSPKQVTSGSEFKKNTDFEFPASPPTNQLSDTQTQNWEPLCHNDTNTQNSTPTRGEMVTVKTQTVPEIPAKRVGAEKPVSVEAAERDWEEKRAALTQYSAKDINRLLEETQAELMKAIPDLDFAAKHKTATSASSTPEHRAIKPQPAQKLSTKIDPNGRRGSDELTVPRYRTEKPSKSPPPPPPRRSFPSSHGLTTTRTGEVIITSKKDAAFIKKSDSEELETQKPQVKLRRTVSEVVRPASTPPIIASGIKDDDDEDRIIAELEVFQRSSGSLFTPQFHCSHSTASQGLPRPAQLWSNEVRGWKHGVMTDNILSGQAAESDHLDTENTAAAASLAQPLPTQKQSDPHDVTRKFSLPQIIFTEWTSNPPSPTGNGVEGSYEVHSKGELGISDILAEEEVAWTYPARKDHVNNIGNTQVVGCNKAKGDELDKSSVWCENRHNNLYTQSTIFGQSTNNDLTSQFSYGDNIQPISKTVLALDNNEEYGKEIVGFMITKDKMTSLTSQEKNNLEKNEELCACRIRFNAGLCSEIVTEDYPDKKYILVEFEEPLPLEDGYKHLLDIMKNTEGSGGPKEVSHERGTLELTIEGFSGLPNQSSQDHGGKPEEDLSISINRISKSVLPVPKPRNQQGKHSTFQSLKHSRPEDTKLQSMTVPEAIQSGGASKMRVIDVQEVMHSSGKVRSTIQADSVAEQDKLRDDGNISWKSMDICRNTYKRLDSLQESIRELEMTINEISIQQPVFFNQNVPIEHHSQVEGLQRVKNEENKDPALIYANNSRDSSTEPHLTIMHKEDEEAGNVSARLKPPLLPKPQILKV